MRNRNNLRKHLKLSTLKADKTEKRKSKIKKNEMDLKKSYVKDRLVKERRVMENINSYPKFLHFAIQKSKIYNQIDF